jgi:hypothetical protein
MGVANLESSTKKREAFNLKVKNLFQKLFTYASPDLAADQVPGHKDEQDFISKLFVFHN